MEERNLSLVEVGVLLNKKMEESISWAVDGEWLIESNMNKEMKWRHLYGKWKRLWERKF